MKLQQRPPSTFPSGQAPRTSKPSVHAIPTHRAPGLMSAVAVVVLALVSCAIIVRAQSQTVDRFVAYAASSTPAPATNASAATPITPLSAAAGTLTGTVTFAGPVPKLDRAKTISPECCGKTASYDRLFVGKNGGVEYTLVYVSNPPAGRPSFAPPTIKQENCRYSPHMAIAARGSSVTFVNKDPVLHNCHGYYYSGTERSTAFNFAQPTQGEQSAQQLRKAGMVNVECDAGHNWMSSWIWVTDNPYVAITDAMGQYSIPGLPPGTYNLVMWHEGYRIVDTQPGGRPVFAGAIVEQKQITVTAGGNTVADFEIK